MMASALALTTSAAFAQEATGDIPPVKLFKNVMVFDGVNDGLKDVDVLVVGNKIHKVEADIPEEGTWEALSYPGLGDVSMSNGAAFADIDNDGDPDLIVGTVGGDRFHLFVNDGRGGFDERGLARGVAQLDEVRIHTSMSLCFGDVDLDGVFLQVRRRPLDGLPCQSREIDLLIRGFAVAYSAEL